MKLIYTLTVSASLVLSACAEHPNRVEAAYIPSIVYTGANCSQLQTEQYKLARHVERFTENQRNASGWDTGAVTVGVLIFWPALATLPFTRDQQAQLAVTRGHYNALVEAGKFKGCPMQAKLHDTHPTEWKTTIAEFPPL